MQKPCLNDKDEFPSDEVLNRYLGKVKTVWDSFMDFLKENHPSFTGQWRYYNDGKSWLYKLTKKKKTICWISVWDKMFKTTFYFPDRAEELIVNSKLKKEYKDQFVNCKRYGNTRGLTVEIKKTTDLVTTKKLIEIKEQFK
jgi:hypothetical protein